MLAFPPSIPAEQQLVYSYTAYMDESGTHEGSRPVTVAGFVSLADMWVDFSGKWQLALNDFDLDHFHMADFANKSGSYSSWTEEERRQRLSRLLYIIADNVLGSVSTTIPVDSFEGIFSARAKAICGGAYGLAAILCFFGLADQLKDKDIDGWVNYVFELGARGAGQIATVFNYNVSDPKQKADLRLGSLRFDDKRRFPPLQAADILAYELYKDWEREEKGRKRRHPLLELANVPRTWGYINDEELQKWNRILSIRATAEDMGLLDPL